jgi:hypothetical protein
MEFFRIDHETIDERKMGEYEDRIIFQTRPWLNFLVMTQGGEPVVAELRRGREILGHFTGLLVKKLGFRILGSPFRGWSTPYMGFNLRKDVSRNEALEALAPFAFEKLKCHHFEVLDKWISMDDFNRDRFDYSENQTYELDITPDEDQLFAGFTSPARRCVRKANKNGVVVEEADDEYFAGEYYEQFEHVVKHHGDIPVYGKERVDRLIEALAPTGNIVRFRARNKEGVCVATGIFLFSNRVMFGWGLASWRHLSNVRPNEAIIWRAMRYWKQKGGEIFDFVGPGDYKKKYGASHSVQPLIRKSRSEMVSKMRNFAALGFKHGKRALARIISGPDKSGEVAR